MPKKKKEKKEKDRVPYLLNKINADIVKTGKAQLGDFHTDYWPEFKKKHPNGTEEDWKTFLRTKEKFVRGRAAAIKRWENACAEITDALIRLNANPNAYPDWLDDLTGHKSFVGFSRQDEIGERLAKETGKLYVRGTKQEDSKDIDFWLIDPITSEMEAYQVKPESWKKKKKKLPEGVQVVFYAD